MYFISLVTLAVRAVPLTALIILVPSDLTMLPIKFCCKVIVGITLATAVVMVGFIFTKDIPREIGGVETPSLSVNVIEIL